MKFLWICIYVKDFPVLCYNEDTEIWSISNEQIRIKSKKIKSKNDINKMNNFM